IPILAGATKPTYGQNFNSTNNQVHLHSGTTSRLPVGDPAVFGQDQWNVYAWNATNGDSWTLNYAGYYTSSSLSFDSQADWDGNGSPSDAGNYLGDPVTWDDHSFAAKRRGFPAGMYTINIPSHDDWAYLIIDGVEVWNHEDCCDYHADVWQGLLTDTSTIEFRVMEFGGGSYGSVELIRNNLNSEATTSGILCHGGTATLNISGTGGAPPYTGTGSFVVSAGTYSYTIFDNIGDSSVVDITINDPALPDSNVSVTGLTTLCQGDSVILSAAGSGTGISFGGDPQRVYIPFNSPETNYTFELSFKTSASYTGLSSVRDGDLGGSHDRNLWLDNGEIYHRLWSEEVINSTGQNYADNQWHHVAVVVEAGVGQRIYVDGILVATGNMDHSDFDWDNTLNIGFSNDWSESEIDNVRIWNVVRTQSEIQSDMNDNISSNAAGLIGNWMFDEGNGTITENSVDHSVGYLYDGPSWSMNNTYSYLWSSGETTQSVSVNNTGNYRVTVTNMNGCAATSEYTSITVNPAPQVPSISTSSLTTFCEGGSAVFTSSEPNDNQWYKDGVAITGETGVTYSATTSGDYSVVVTNGSGCSKTSSVETVIVNSNPVVAAGPDITLGICNPEYVLTNGTPAGGIYNGMGVNNAIFDPAIGVGTYTVSYYYEDGNGCASTSTADITVEPAPVVTLAGLTPMCTTDQPIQLTGGSPAGGMYSGQGVNGILFDPSIGMGIYAITYSYTDANGCSSSASKNMVVDVCTGIQSAVNNSGVSVYPNPAKDLIRVSYFSDNTSLKLIQLFSVEGQLVFQKELNEKVDSAPLDVIIPEQAAGCYTLRLHGDLGTVNKKLLIQ
ncbi:MAG TPA: T9SS type A sorting domain-containing protein, partial [Bacteroidia bacterium]|nr:T9SS type A sorting domain-containing protein [Bacteroidia bacterium]